MFVATLGSRMNTIYGAGDTYYEFSLRCYIVNLISSVLSLIITSSIGSHSIELYPCLTGRYQPDAQLSRLVAFIEIKSAAVTK